MMGLVSLKMRKRLGLALHPPCEDIARKQPSASHEEGPFQNGDMLASVSDFQPPKLCNVNSCYLSHLVHGILLEQPKLTKIYLYLYLYMSLYHLDTDDLDTHSYIVVF